MSGGVNPSEKPPEGLHVPPSFSGEYTTCKVFKCTRLAGPSGYCSVHIPFNKQEKIVH